MEQNNKYKDDDYRQEIEAQAPFLGRVLDRLDALDQVADAYFEYLEEVVLTQQNLESNLLGHSSQNLPENYFQNLEQKTVKLLSEDAKQPRKVVFNKIWLSAAAVVLFLMMGTLVFRTINDQNGETMDQTTPKNLTAFVDNLNENDVDLLVNDLTSSENMSLLLGSGLVSEQHIDDIDIQIFDDENAESLEELLDLQDEALMN
ncbi:MAG TPA: hypothetical protein PKD18_01050 [Saprospiraceae bacterium]|nr:hypothetical protein [Saprospiraceae bacterium]